MSVWSASQAGEPLQGWPRPVAAARQADAPASAVSWGSIAAGAAAAAALSLILLVLGVGLGLSSVSPWARGGINATAFGVSTIVWLTLTQLLASAMGGYLAGRLRTRWAALHSDEVYFRDTAHGFLAWAMASLATAALLTSTIGSILGVGAQAGASAMGGAASAAIGGAAAPAQLAQGGDNGSMAYFVDALFRRDPAAAASSTLAAGSSASNDANERASARDAAEISRIFLHVSRSEPLPVDDSRHIAQIVAQRTGMSQQDAQRRVVDVYGRAQAKAQEAETAARAAADRARKASAHGSLWLFISLLGGAFVASLSATFGGRRRDA